MVEWSGSVPCVCTMCTKYTMCTKGTMGTMYTLCTLCTLLSICTQCSSLPMYRCVACVPCIPAIQCNCTLCCIIMYYVYNVIPWVKVHLSVFTLNGIGLIKFLSCWINGVYVTIIQVCMMSQYQCAFRHIKQT